MTFRRKRGEKGGQILTNMIHNGVREINSVVDECEPRENESNGMHDNWSSRLLRKTSREREYEKEKGEIKWRGGHKHVILPAHMQCYGRRDECGEDGMLTRHDNDGEEWDRNDSSSNRPSVSDCWLRQLEVVTEVSQCCNVVSQGEEEVALLCVTLLSSTEWWVSFFSLLQTERWRGRERQCNGEKYGERERENYCAKKRETSKRESRE